MVMLQLPSNDDTYDCLSLSKLNSQEIIIMIGLYFWRFGVIFQILGGAVLVGKTFLSFFFLKRFLLSSVLPLSLWFIHSSCLILDQVSSPTDFSLNHTVTFITTIPCFFSVHYFLLRQTASLSTDFFYERSLTLSVFPLTGEYTRCWANYYRSDCCAISFPCRDR